MSEFTEKKAQNLIDTKCIIQIDDDTYQVKSSTPEKSTWTSLVMRYVSVWDSSFEGNARMSLQFRCCRNYL